MAASSSKPMRSAELAWQPDNLPPFPAVALKALNLLAGTDTSLPTLCNLIKSDPAFSTAVLKIANSPLVAFPCNLTNMLQASMLLGFHRLRAVVMALGLKAYLKDPFTPILHSCWRHSVACAMIAERLAKSSGLDKDFAFTAGVMHDIGRIALAVTMKDSYGRVIEAGADRPRDLLQAEWELCGIDHCQAGRSLVTAWNLPEAFMEVISYHHEPASGTHSTVSVLHLSCQLADCLGFRVVDYRNPGCYAKILSDLPDSVSKSFPGDGEELASEIRDEMKVIETV